MGRRSEVMKLPVAVRCELDERLRQAAYGDYLGVSAWLAAQGYEVSKSAMHRYGTALRQVDASSGRQDAQVAQVAQASGSSERGRRDGLLLELGRLRYREAQIIDEISQLDSGISH